MLKKIGFVTTGVAAGMMLLGSFAATTASAETSGLPGGLGSLGANDQVGLVNLDDIDLLDNLNVGVCDVQIVHEVANGLALPILSPGITGAGAMTPDMCAAANL